MKLTETAVKVPTLTIVATLLVVMWGLSYFNSMPRREDPDIEIIACWVLTTYPGALPEEVEQYVSKPIEDVVAEISEVDEIRSESNYSFSRVTIILDEDTPQNKIKQIWDNTRAKIDSIRDDLPEGCGDPILSDDVFDTCSHIVALTGENYTPREMEAFGERIKKRLGDLPSAGTVRVEGAQEEQIYVEFNPERLAFYRMTLNDLAGALQSTNTLYPGGALNLAGNEYSISSPGGFKSIDDIQTLPVYTTKDGQQVRLADVAEVRYGSPDPPEHLCRLNGEPATLVSVSMKDGRNVMQLGREVEAELENIRQSLPEDVGVTLVHDQPHEVNLTTNTFLSNLYQGFFLVFLVVFLFMGFRPSIPVGLAVPLSLIGSFAIFSMLGTQLQRMSIGGLIITLGMLVDNAIVITDMAQRYVDEGMERRAAAIKATKTLMVPVFTSTLTTVAAFGPLLMMPGMIGEFIADIPITVSVAIGMSFVVAVTVTPTICAYLLVSTTKYKTFQPLDPLMKLLERNYPPLLAWTQRNVTITTLIVIGAFVGALVVGKTLGVQFFPAASRDQFVIDMFAPEGTSIFETNEMAAGIEKILSEQTGIVNYTVSVGEGGPKFYGARFPNSPSTSLAEFLVVTESGKDSTRLAPIIHREAFARVPGCRTEVKLLELGPAVGTPIQLEIHGASIEKLRAIGAQLKDILESVDGTIDIYDSFGIERPQLRLNADPASLRAAGLTTGDINRLTALLTSGYPVTNFRAPERTIPVTLRALPEYRDESADLSRIYIANRVNDGQIPLSSLATLETADVTGKIERLDRSRKMTVNSNLKDGYLAADVLAEVWPQVHELDLPPGYEITESGMEDHRKEAFGKVVNAMFTALLLIMIVLVGQFQSLRIALVVYLAIPLALIGAILGLFFSGWPIGFMAMLGILSLIGIVIKNSIVLVDFIMDKLRSGVPLDQAISESGQARLRPIILATATTVGGLLPLGLFGGGMWAPMAWAIIGGLLVSTVLTLIVVPLFFRLVAGKRALELINGKAGSGDQSPAASQTEYSPD